jgi:hypothetical protein
MKKIVIAVVASLGVLVAGCSCTPDNRYAQQQGYDAPYSQGYAQPTVVQQRDGHGDALLAGAAGLAAGHYLGKRSERKAYNNYRSYRPYRAPRTVYTSRPSRSYSSFSSPSRSSSRGSYRSRR